MCYSVWNIRFKIKKKYDYNFENKPTNEVIISDCIDNYFSDKLYTKLMIFLNNERDKNNFF